MTLETGNLTGKDLFLKHFENAEERLSTGPGAWLAPVRKTALSRFGRIGFPTPRMEAWKHTNPAPALTPEYTLPEGTIPALDPALFDRFTFGGWEADRLVFINGRYSEALSTVGKLPKGARIANLATALKTDRDILEKHLTRVVGFQEQAFAALNTALFEDGGLLYLPKGTVLEKPVHFLYIASAPEGAPVAIHPRTLVVAEENSSATLVESYETTGETVYLNNPVTEVVAGPNTRLDHYRLQQDSRAAFHFSNTEMRQGRDARFSSHVISLGALISRNDIVSVMGGEGIESVLNGLFLPTGKQQVDHHTKLDHAKPHCTSHELFKGILDDQASGAFTGRIIVRPDAQKTDAVQSSRNLLLSDEAKITPDPQLEIYADDVKCTHGATIGQLDQDAIFYLQTRGIDRESAIGLLTYAFANEIIDEIQIEPIRDRLEQSLSARFGKGSALER